MTTTHQQRAARDFAKLWQGKGYEKGESQSFWLELLTEVLGIEHPSEFLHFEHDYLAPYPPQKIRRALIDLFEVLDTPLADRDPYLDDDLAAFPYVNGGLFDRHAGTQPSSAAEDLPHSGTSAYPIIIPQFTEELKQLLLEKASAWRSCSRCIRSYQHN